MSEKEATLDDFAQEENESQEETDRSVAVGELQQLEESPIESWNLVKLVDILTLEYGDNLPSDSRVNGAVPVYGSNGQVDTHIEAAVNRPGIILGRKGSIGEIAFSDEPFWPIDTTYYITDEETDQNLHFLYYLLQNIQLERLNAASAIPGLNRNDTYGLNALSPPLEEQRKIASVLYTVDQAIQKTEEIITQIDRTKLGLYQRLFFEGYDQHSAFKSTKYGEIPEQWQIKKLSEITSQIQAGGTPDTNHSEYYGGSIPWIKTGELSQARISDTEEYITGEGLKNSTARTFEPGTVLIAMYGATTGEVALLEIEATSNQACCGVVTKEELQPEFLYHQLQYFSDRLESLSAGSGQQNISKGIIEKFDVLVPPVHEQNSIVDVLNSADESIIRNRQVKQQFECLKQGLMQDLISGDIRTLKTDIEIVDEVLQHG